MIELLSMFATMPGGLGDAFATSLIEHDVSILVRYNKTQSMKRIIKQNKPKQNHKNKTKNKTKQTNKTNKRIVMIELFID